MTDYSKFKTQLILRRNYLAGKSESIEDDFENSGGDAFDGDDPQVRDLDVLDDLDEMAQSEIRAIDAALARFKAGEYGVCVTCGDPIDLERLSAVPHTPFCKDHAP